MSSQMLPHPAPSLFSDWTEHSLTTPRSSVSSAPRQIDSSFCSEFSPLPPTPPQLKQWQQHMQEQLRAHQWDQQRLLGMKLLGYPESSVLSGRGFADSQPELFEMDTPPRHTHHLEQRSLEVGGSSTTPTTPQHEVYSQEQRAASTLDRPIRPGLGLRAHTFEELLEKELKLEEERQKGKSPVLDEGAGPKRSFLRKGAGRTASRPPPHYHSEPRMDHREPASMQREPLRDRLRGPAQQGSRSLEPSSRGPSRLQAKCTHTHTNPKPTAPPIQRKTATLSSHTQAGHSHTHTPSERTHTHIPSERTHTHTQMLSPCRAPVAMETSFDVWQRERQREWVELGEFELLEAAAEELSITSSSSSFLQALGVCAHTRRLSSTPIKTRTVSSHTHTTAQNTVSSHTHTTDTHTHTADTPTKPAHTHIVKEEQGPGVDEDDEEEEEEDITHCLPVATPLYDRCTYQEPEEAEQGEETECLSDGVGVEFDDDDTWADESQHALQPETTLKRKVAMATGEESGATDDTHTRTQNHTHTHTHTSAHTHTQNHTHTHTHPSQLVAKLFPALQPKPRPTPVTQTSPPKSQSEGMSEVMRERVVLLEMEIERFKMETAELTRLRTSLHTQQQELRKEKAEFEAKRSEAQAEWEEFKQAEMRKLQRDRKLFEKHSTARNTHTSAQREEILAVKQQLCELKEECMRKEQRWRNTHTRLQQQIHTLNTHNQELRQQIHTLENLRLSAWRQQRQQSREQESRGEEERRREEEKEDKRKEEEKGLSGPSSPECNSNSSDDHRCGGHTTSSGSGDGDVMPPVCVFDDITSAELHATPGEQLSSQQEEEITHPDGKIERVFKDGSRLLLFLNGTQKMLSTDGSTKVNFFNGDIKEICPDHRVVYFFADAQTTHTTFPDGTELLQFPNNQTEKLFPDGKKEIVFPDQTMKTLYPDGREESILPDGTIIRLNAGLREVVFVSGEREEHTAEWRRRVYTDGTVKTVYTDGRQETHYASGRVRIKDPQGRVLKDTHTHAHNNTHTH